MSYHVKATLCHDNDIRYIVAALVCMVHYLIPLLHYCTNSGLLYPHTIKPSLYLFYPDVTHLSKNTSLSPMLPYRK